jgi:hypothetical protein
VLRHQVQVLLQHLLFVLLLVHCCRRFDRGLADLVQMPLAQVDLVLLLVTGREKGSLVKVMVRVESRV